MLTTVSSAGGGAAQADTYLVLMLMMAVYSATGAAMYATGPELAAERANGWLRQLLTTPLVGRSGRRVGSGLTNIADRVAALNGEATFTNQAPSGFTIRALLPTVPDPTPAGMT